MTRALMTCSVCAEVFVLAGSRKKRNRCHRMTAFSPNPPLERHALRRRNLHLLRKLRRVPDHAHRHYSVSCYQKRPKTHGTDLAALSGITPVRETDWKPTANDEPFCIRRPRPTSLNPLCSPIHPGVTLHSPGVHSADESGPQSNATEAAVKEMDFSATGKIFKNIKNFQRISN